MQQTTELKSSLTERRVPAQLSHDWLCLQHSNAFADAMIGWAGQGSCHGLRIGSGISGISISIAIPLISSTRWRTEFSDRSLSVSSITWVFRTVFSESSLAYCSVNRLTCIKNWLFSSFSRATWLSKSSKCCCFLIRDLLADSRFESILLRFLSSIIGCASSSEPEVWGAGTDDTLFYLGLRSQYAQESNRSRIHSLYWIEVIKLRNLNHEIT